MGAFCAVRVGRGGGRRAGAAGGRCGGDPSPPAGCCRQVPPHLPTRCHRLPRARGSPRPPEAWLVLPLLAGRLGPWRCRQEELPARRKPQSTGADAELLPEPPFPAAAAPRSPLSPPPLSATPHPRLCEQGVTQIPLAQPQEPWSDAGASKEPSRTGRGSGEDRQGAQPSPKSPLEEQPGSEAAVPLCRKPGLADVRAERDASPELPASCQPRGEDEQGAGSPAGVLSSPQPGLGDLGGVTAPQIPASATVREAGPQGKGRASPHRGL